MWQDKMCLEIKATVEGSCTSSAALIAVLPAYRSPHVRPPSALPTPHTFSLTHSTKASAGRLCKRRCRDAGSAGQQRAWGRGQEERASPAEACRVHSVAGGVVGAVGRVGTLWAPWDIV